MLGALRNRREPVLLGVVLTIALRWSEPQALPIGSNNCELKAQTAIPALKCLGQKVLAQRDTNVEPNGSQLSRSLMKGIFI